MHIRTLPLLSFSLVFISGATVWAENQPKLKLQPLIQEALGKNLSLKISRHQSQAQEGKIGPAGSYPDPKAAFEFSNFPVDSYSASVTPMTGREIRLSQEFPFPGKLTKKRNAAEHRFEASRQSVKQKELETVFLVKAYYYRLYFAHRTIDITREKKRILDQFVKIANAKYSVGKGLQQDVLKAQVEQSETTKKLILLREKLESLKSKMNTLLNRPPIQALKVPESFPLTDVDFETLPMKWLIQLSVEKNPELARARKMTKSAESELSFAKWDYLPNFELGLKYRIRQANRIDNGTNFASAFISMSLPLYVFSKQSQKHKSASEKFAATDSQQDMIYQTLEKKIKDTYVQAIESKNLVILYRDRLIVQAEQALKSAEVGYQVDKVDFLMLLNNEKSLFDHKIGLEEARTDYEIAIALLEALTATHSLDWKAKGTPLNPEVAWVESENKLEESTYD